MTWSAAKAAETLNPPQVQYALDSIAENWPRDAEPLESVVETFPLGEAALLHLLAISSICVNRLIHDPSLLLWLTRPAICATSRSHRAMIAQLYALAGDSPASDSFRALRVWKSREMLRIALREVAGIATLPHTTAELSQVAEICVAEVYRYWNDELRQRRGSPDAQFAILALGKLGGRELNHSSDIDVIFAYSEEGQLTPSLTYHQWFNLLSEKIVETFSARHPAGALFRIDLRLRPEGTAGPLARSLESMENYYAGFGETWERLALVKARGIAGSRELAYEFLRQHQPFVFPKSPSRDLLDEIFSIKRRIERDIVGHENLERNVKLGAGGIREIEFIVQALQLLHGARHTFLQEPSTLRALPLLAELDLLPGGEARVLQQAYYFLRDVEHRLQIEAEQQTHTVPDDPAALRRLALSLGFSSADDFLRHLREQMQNVRAIFDRVIGETARDPERSAATLEIFRDQKTAARSIGELAQARSSFHVAPRTRQVFRRFEPLLLDQLARTADPDTTLNQFVRFVDAYGMRSMLLELLTTHPRLLELLVKTFDASRYASDLLVRRPQLVEEITRSGRLDQSLDAAQHLRRLGALNATAAALDPVRAYRHTETLRIMLRDVLGLSDLAGVHAELSALAEACLTFVDQLRGSVADLTIIALGKFGGGEISYGADLDVIFVGDNTRAAQHLMVALAQATAEGAIFTLDPRLRPDGEKGALAPSLSAFDKYYEQRAQLWEIQALTRARPIAGPAGDDFLRIAKRAWREAGRQPDLFSAIASMVDRIRRERAGLSDELDFKAGTGGMITAEFLVQALQMRFELWQQNTGNALSALAAAGHIDGADAAQLRKSYAFLRAVESVLRRHENKSVSLVPNDPLAQQHLARRLGLESLDAFAEQYRGARTTIHEIYSRYISG